MFWKSVPERDWPTDEEYLASIKNLWVEPFGDMRQELVFIGQGLDKEKMIQALDNCLLNEEEVLKGRIFGKPWKTLFLLGVKFKLIVMKSIFSDQLSDFSSIHLNDVEL